jgi:lambda repressor-like predicted transcriptional regulator
LADNSLSGEDMANQAPIHREQIKASIRMRYGTLLAFEAARALPPGSTKDVLRGRSVRRTAEAIAEFMDVPVNSLFPGRFAEANDTSTGADMHRLNKTAA